MEIFSTTFFATVMLYLAGTLLIVLMVISMQLQAIIKILKKDYD